MVVYANFLCLIALFCQVFSQDLTRKLKLQLSIGKIVGRLVETNSGNVGWAFQGVPYAEPPTGKLRFALPADKKRWQGTLQCFEYKPACWQNVSNAGETVETVLSEDCLYANVFVGIGCLPKKRFSKQCPVIYYIHGGGNEFDSPRMFDPKILIDNFASKNLVYVTVSYRLGVFGYWSTGTDQAFGNWALHDMVKGAEWIQREIRNFGGDPGHVTAMGHSSSSMALSLLTLSPKVARSGLFNQVALLSGTSCKRYGALSQNLSDYVEVAHKLGCFNNPQNFSNFEALREQYGGLQKIIDCMRRIDFTTLGNVFNEMRGDKTATGNSDRMTLPRIDGPNGLFPRSLTKLIASRAPITLITGTTKNELGYKKLLFANATSKTVLENCRFIVQRENWKNQGQIIDACLEEYAGNETYPLLSRRYVKPQPFNDTPTFWGNRVSQLLEDNEYFAPSYTEASSMASQKATVYLYSFDYEKAGLRYISPWHAFDMAYLNGLHIDDFVFNEDDEKIAKVYQSLFVNFALYGDPTYKLVNGVTWQPLADQNSFNYLSIDLHTEMKQNYHVKGVTFWNKKIYEIEKSFGIPIPTEDEPQFSRNFSLKSPATNFSTYNEKSYNPGGLALYAGFILLLLGNVGLFIFLLGKPRRMPKKGETRQLISSDQNQVNVDYGSIAE